MVFLGGVQTGVGVLPEVGGVGAGLLLGEDEAVLWILDWTEEVSTVVLEEEVVVIPDEVVEVLELIAAAAAAAAARWAMREARGSCVSFCSQLV